MDLQELVNKYKGYFVVNYDNFEVIYTEGYENENGLWCYKLSDLSKEPELPKPIEITTTEQTEENGANQGENTEGQSEENAQTEGESAQE